MENQIIEGNCLEVMKGIEDNSVDLIVTDPPFGIGFMGKSWDTFKPKYLNKMVTPPKLRPKRPYIKGNKKYKGGTTAFEIKSTYAETYDRSFNGNKLFQEFIYQTALQCLRILKNGAFMFMCMTPRQDSLARAMIAIEDAGFNTGFTSIYWTYASGFNKSGNIGKFIDKREFKKFLQEYRPQALKFQRRLWDANERDYWAWKWCELAKERFGELIGKREKIGMSPYYCAGRTVDNFGIAGEGITGQRDRSITTPSTPQAKALDGSYAGFQPKPAVEVILVAMKPLLEKTYVDQALKNGKGITWLDDVRVPYESEGDKKIALQKNSGNALKDRDNLYGGYGDLDPNWQKQGRFPPNLLVSDDVLNDGKVSKSIGGCVAKDIKGFASNNQFVNYNDSGSFSRYFSLDKWFAKQLKKLPIGVQKTFPFLIVPKASKGEKNRGLEGFEEKSKCNIDKMGGSKCTMKTGSGNKRNVKYKNNHPTVKPLKLMSYLITLGSREGDLVLDPFVGSGTTCIACKQLNRRFIGIDNNSEYIKIAKARLEAVQPNLFASIGG